MPGRKIGIILQARMGSTRLPGKVMKPLAGKPMIQWIIERLRRCRRPDTLILATSTSRDEEPLIELVTRLGVMLFRGSEHDVLDRYYQCARAHELDDVVRATGDNPFVDPVECDRLAEFYADRRLDYATIVTGAPDGFPLGVGVEIFSRNALERSWREGHAPHHREHVDEYILENPGIFRQARMPAPFAKRAPGLSLTVDLPRQFRAAEKMYKNYIKQHPSTLVPAGWAIRALTKRSKGV
jgi:spore coat polysaccharide biosynthesis protein SpsF